MSRISDEMIPEPARAALRGLGQIIFQESALTGIAFVIGIAVGSPLMAVCAAIGAAIGTATARFLKFDPAELSAGLFGFNSALVGMAVPFFFRPGFASMLMMVLGSAAAAPLTRWMRRNVPFPTYTTPFILLTWAIFFLGRGMGLETPAAGASFTVGFGASALHGVSQVMFQASAITGLLFLVGIALNDWKHALWVLAGAAVGTLVGSYHATVTARALDPERLIERALIENISLGLYGYNASLAGIALSLWRRSLVPALLGMLLSVPLTEAMPLIGLPALTAPFVLAVWLVIGLYRVEDRLLGLSTPPPS